MPAIFSTNAIIMGPAKMMDHASVILDSLATTVQVNLQRPFMIGADIYCCFLPGFLILLAKTLKNASKNVLYTLQILFLIPNSLAK